MAQTFPSTKVDQGRPYTLLSIGGRTLLLPQSEICTLAPIQDLSLVGRRASGVVGWLPFAGRRCAAGRGVESLTQSGEVRREASGSSTYLRAKAGGDKSMSEKRESQEGVYGAVPQDPRDMVKAILPEPQFPVVEPHTHRYHA